MIILNNIRSDALVYSYYPISLCFKCVKHKNEKKKKEYEKRKEILFYLIYCVGLIEKKNDR